VVKSRKILSFLGKFGVGITSNPNLISLYEKQEALNFTESKLSIFQNFYRKNPTKFLNFFSLEISFLEIIQSSKSQIGQDLLALVVNNFKQDGFFVEFGATNGVSNSNTYLLEKRFGWRGILCEPAKIWQKSLIHNRKVQIDFDCVWSKSDENILFNETINVELSTIDQFSNSDLHSIERYRGKKYEVRSISLNDLLAKYNAPFQIDYLSIDTEGSELEILSNFDFSRYNIRFISCEHNFESNREKIKNLLLKNGFKRFYEDLSEFDDWYIQKDLLESEGFI
jgi:FkbM family methyltransferase